MPNSFMNLLFNGVIMLSLLSLYSINKFKYKREDYVIKILRGIVLGIITVLVMAKPWESNGSGVIYDARNIVLSISGVFFGFVPTLIASLFAISFRIYLAFSSAGLKLGLALGIVEIIISSLIGILWPLISKNFTKKLKVIEYILMGFIVHVSVMMLVYVIPNQIPDNTMELLLPYLIIYPIFTAIAALILSNHYSFIELTDITKSQESILNATINATKTMEVYALDKEFNYLAFNKFHSDMMQEYYMRKVEKGKNFYDYLENSKMIERLKKYQGKALLGVEHKVVSEIEVTPNKFVEETFSPILDENDNVIGVTVFSIDVSERVHQRNELEYLSYHDHLTGLYNRRYFEKLVEKYNKENINVAVIYFDINGLKIINDTFGHKEGDRLIIEVVRNIKSSFEKEVEVCRIGGDEFLVFLPNETIDYAFEKANKIKDKVSKLFIKNINYSISYGVSINNNKTMEETIKDAENVMIRNKLIEKSSHRGANIPAILNTLNIMHRDEKDHSERVSNFVSIIANELELSNTMVGLLKMIAKLHDIGKIGIDQEILNKPGKLTVEEFNEIKRHPMIGYQLLSAVPEYSEIAYDVLSHHERYDGTGYPNGLKGNEIPFRARVISVADAFDAMTSDRPYRKALSYKDALKELKQNRGTQFDPEIVDAFINGLKKKGLYEE